MEFKEKVLFVRTKLNLSQIDLALENINFSVVINSILKDISNDNNFSNVFLPPNEFMHEIEMYYANPNSKNKF